jgi:hypothetical protein
MRGRLDRGRPLPFGQIFPEPYDSRSNPCTTAAAAWRVDSDAAGREIGNARRMLVWSPAALTAGTRQGPMQVEQRAACSALVQVVYILSYQREGRYLLSHSGNDTVSAVWLRLQYEHAPPLIPAPHEGCVAIEGMTGRQLRSFVQFPKPRLSISKRRYATLGGNASARQHDNMPRSAELIANVCLVK